MAFLRVRGEVDAGTLQTAGSRALIDGDMVDSDVCKLQAVRDAPRRRESDGPV